ncbi:hypothetical protein KCP77_07115 [Salmonella enterica subsp. enterica]|nr:hypothetical protein KCP77_07115 [Salmonella enterica subsp. enterica]
MPPFGPRRRRYCARHHEELTTRALADGATDYLDCPGNSRTRAYRAGYAESRL